DSEQMLVTALSSIGGGKYNVTVTRGYSSTTAATHAANAQIVEMVTSNPGSAAEPSTCTINKGGSQTTTLSPGDLLRRHLHRRRRLHRHELRHEYAVRLEQLRPRPSR